MRPRSPLDGRHLRVQDKVEAYDAGIRAAAAHLIDGAPPPRSPWAPGTRRTAYFNKAARNFSVALAPVLEAWR